MLKPQNQIKPQANYWQQKPIVKARATCASITPSSLARRASALTCSAQPNTDLNGEKCKKVTRFKFSRLIKSKPFHHTAPSTY